MNPLTAPHPARAADDAVEPLVTLRDVSIAYDGGHGFAVRDVDLLIRRGESTLFLGPSGCGKSTLALLCAGLIPGAVEAQVTGRVWCHSDLTDPGGVGVVFQDPETQFCMIRVDDEMAFGLENQRISRADMLDRIPLALQESGLSVPSNEPHTTLSGGMKQKLAIASALVLNPVLLILDEPTANLDPRSTRMVFEHIRRLREAGQTMVVIEHKFDALLPWMDTVVLFNRQGEVHRVGNPEEIIRDEWEWLIAEGIVPPWKTRWDERHSGIDTGKVVAQERNAKPGGKAALVLKNAALRYGEKTVWKDVDLAIPTGSMTAIVGPNGAGKSSLLLVLAGLQALNGGESILPTQTHAKQRRVEPGNSVAYCFQNPEHQFIYERVGDELANRIIGEDLPEEPAQLLREFELADCVDQSPFSLSQGQKRRLSVASMLRADHDVYLLDEPTFGQDAHTQQVIMDRLASLQTAGKTVVMTTHDMDLVRRFATHVIVLAHGCVQFFGNPSELWGNPHIVRDAHLFDEVDTELPASVEERDRGEERGTGVKAVSPDVWSQSIIGRWAPAKSINPGMQLFMAIAAAALSMFAGNLGQATAMFAMPIVLMLGVAWMSPWRIVKRMSPFIGFYALYVVTLAGYSAVPPGEPVYHVLWLHFSHTGFVNGFVLALRMLGTVGFTVLLFSSVDVTATVVSLSKNFRIPPRFSYGVLSGIRFLPLFRSEWTKLRLARRLRGKERGLQVFRPIVYAMPLLSQAIRMSERIAIAMEARGFVGAAAASSTGRSYYRDVVVRLSDFIYLGFIVTTLVGVLLWFR